MVNMDMRACMADEGTKEKDSLLFVRVHLRCRRREEAADPGLYGFRDTSLLSTEKKKVSSTTTLSASFSPSFSLISLNYFLSFWFLQMNSSPAHGGGGESLHCGWETVAAPVADVSGKRRHVHPIGHSPPCAIIERGCVWKKMIMAALNSFATMDNHCHAL